MQHLCSQDYTIKLLLSSSVVFNHQLFQRVPTLKGCLSLNPALWAQLVHSPWTWVLHGLSVWIHGILQFWFKTWFPEFPLAALHTPASLAREIQRSPTVLSAHVTDAVILSYQSRHTCRLPHTAAFQRIHLVLRPTRFSCTYATAMKQVSLSQAHSFAACPCEVSKLSFRHALVQLNRKDRPLQAGLRPGGRGHQSMSNKCICTHLVRVIAMWHFWTSVVAQSFSNWLLPTLPVVSRVHQEIQRRWFDAWHWEGICCQQHLQMQSGAHPAVVIYSCRVWVVWKRSGLLSTVLILRMHGSILPLPSNWSGIAPSVWSIHYQHILHHYQHFILTVFSRICWK